MKKVYILLGLLILSFGSFSSTDSLEVIEISSLTGTPKSPFPFDRPFIIKIPREANQQKIETIRIRKLNQNQIPKPFKCYEKERVWVTYRAAKMDKVIWGCRPSVLRNKRKLIKTVKKEKSRLESQYSFLSYGSKDNVLVLSGNLGNEIYEKKEKYFLFKVFPLNPKQTYEFLFTYKNDNVTDVKKIWINKEKKNLFSNLKFVTSYNGMIDSSIRYRNEIALLEKNRKELNTLKKSYCDLLHVFNQHLISLEALKDNNCRVKTLVTNALSELIKEKKKLSHLSKLFCVDTSMECKIVEHCLKVPQNCIALTQLVNNEINKLSVFKNEIIRLQGQSFPFRSPNRSCICDKKFKDVKKSYKIASKKCKEFNSSKKIKLSCRELYSITRKKYNNSCNSYISNCYPTIYNKRDKLFADTIAHLKKQGKPEAALEITLLYDFIFNQNKLIKGEIPVKTLQNKLDILDFDFSHFLKSYQDLMKKLESCDLCSKEGKRLYSNFWKDSARYRFRVNIDKTQRFIAKGLLPINYKVQTELVEEFEISKRITNLKVTALTVEELLSIQYLWFGVDDDVLKLELKKIYQTIEELKKFDKLLKLFTKRLTDFQIGGQAPLANFKTAGINKSSKGHATLSTKSKFSVRPDFGVGFASNLLVANDALDPYSTAIPFFGVRLNFRPLDPDYPFQNIPYKTFWHRSSVNISYSFTSLADDSGTRSDLYDKRSFLLGYGFRLNNAVNLTAGGVFFNRENPDPFISGNQLTVMPYIGASVDLDIFDTFNKLFNVFSK